MRVASLVLFSVLSWCPPSILSAAAEDKPPVGPPVKLEDGKPVLQEGARLYLPQGTLVESYGKPLTGLGVTRLWLVPPKQEKWVYEVRPLGSGSLEIQVAKDAFKEVKLLRPALAYEDGREPDGFLPDHHLMTDGASVTWVGQPYEIRDRAGKVLYATPLPARPEPGMPLVPAPGGRRHSIALHSGVLTPKLTLPESPRGVTSLRLMATVDHNGEGDGTLILDPSTLQFNEVGEVIGATRIEGVGLQCSLKFVKTSKVRIDITPGLDREEEWPIYELRGKKLTSRLFLAAQGRELQWGRLLIQDREGKVVSVIPLHSLLPFDMIHANPCHPGCFPAGTQVLTPKGTRPIDAIRAGDLVLSIGPDGTSVPVQVQSVFVTRNSLVRVETEAGNLVTTRTQSLCLEDGQTRSTEDLKPGDRILRWHEGKRQAVKVRQVVALDLDATPRRFDEVFNLILGNSEVFVAGGFLARSKPPVVAEESAPPLRGPETAVPGTNK